MKHPNILFIMADQLRPQSCGYMGDSKAKTPNIDNLASKSCNFVNATSMHPICGPYRASLFTGCYSSTTGYVINELSSRTDLPTLAGSLNDVGYRSAYFGKWHLWAAEAKNLKTFHKKTINQFVPPGPSRLGFNDHWTAYNFNHHYYKGFYFENTPHKRKLAGYEPDAITDKLLAYLSDDRPEPFFCCISFGTPHQPWGTKNVPDYWMNLFQNTEFELPDNYKPGSGEYWHSWYDKQWWDTKVAPNLTSWMRSYYAMTANLDWNIGRILDGLKRYGYADNTIIVFTSDHGEMFGAHGRVQKNVFYDEAVRVPMLIHMPNAEGSISDACINTPDLMPTILGLFGVSIPETVEGMNLSHLVMGETGPEPSSAFLQGMGPSVDWDDGFEWRALRNKQFTYALHRKDKREELYETQEDPLQLNNLRENSNYMPVLRGLRTELHNKMNGLNDEFEKITWYRDNWIENGQVMRGASK